MKYLQEGIGEITKAEFEEILGPNIVVGPSSGATVTALEASRAETHMSCIVYLDQEPPLWLRVLRENSGYLLIKDWKFENGRYFCPVEISGGPYDATDPLQAGAFTLSMFDVVASKVLVTISGIGWDHNTNHRHPNIYVSLQDEPPVEPPIEPPVEPPVEPPTEPPTGGGLEKIEMLLKEILVELRRLSGNP